MLVPGVVRGHARSSGSNARGRDLSGVVVVAAAVLVSVTQSGSVAADVSGDGVFTPTHSRRRCRTHVLATYVSAAFMAGDSDPERTRARRRVVVSACIGVMGDQSCAGARRTNSSGLGSVMALPLLIVSVSDGIAAGLRERRLP